MSGLARVDLGQRVYVERDGDRGEIGEWGTVARLNRLDGGVWVKLDKRHPRCPFPATDATRSTHVLTYLIHCSSIAPVEVSPRCSHTFVDSAVCLECGKHCSDLYLEQLDLDGDGLLVRARQAVRFVQRFGEPLTAAGRERLADLRELLEGAS